MRDESRETYKVTINPTDEMVNHTRVNVLINI